MEKDIIIIDPKTELMSYNPLKSCKSIEITAKYIQIVFDNALLAVLNDRS